MTTFTSSLVRPTSLTRGITRNGRMMSLVVRYLQEGKNSSCNKLKSFYKMIIICFSLFHVFLIHVSQQTIYLKIEWAVWTQTSSMLYAFNMVRVSLTRALWPPTLFCHIQLSSGQLNNKLKKGFKKISKIHLLTSWAHTLHQGGWSWCYALSQTYWGVHTGGKCSHRWL